MPWSYVGHVSTIEHHRDDIIVENLPELFSDIISTERVFQGEVELKMNNWDGKRIMASSVSMVKDKKR